MSKNITYVTAIKFITEPSGNVYLQFVHEDGRESRLVYIRGNFRLGDTLFFKWGGKPDESDFSIAGTFES